MKASDFSIITWGQQDIAVESPAQICDTHHAEIHHDREWLL